jgi:hypothetical protein
MSQLVTEYSLYLRWGALLNERVVDDDMLGPRKTIKVATIMSLTYLAH